MKTETKHSSKTTLRYQRRNATVTVRTWLAPTCVLERRHCQRANVRPAQETGQRFHRLSNDESGSIFRWRSNNDAAFGILSSESTLSAIKQQSETLQGKLLLPLHPPLFAARLLISGFYATILQLLSTCKKLLSTCKSHVQPWNIACKNHVQVWNIEIYFIATDQQDCRIKQQYIIIPMHDIKGRYDQIQVCRKQFKVHDSGIGTCKCMHKNNSLQLLKSLCKLHSCTPRPLQLL